MALGYDWMAAQAGANRHNAAQRRIGEQHAQTLADLDYQGRRSGLEDSALARSMLERQFGEDRRQFDVGNEQFGTRMNLLRELVNRQQPDYFGQPQPAPQRPMAGIGSGGNSFQPPQQGGFNPELRNYLMRYLRG